MTPATDAHAFSPALDSPKRASASTGRVPSVHLVGGVAVGERRPRSPCTGAGVVSGQWQRPECERSRVPVGCVGTPSGARDGGRAHRAQPWAPPRPMAPHGGACLARAGRYPVVRKRKPRPGPTVRDRIGPCPAHGPALVLWLGARHLRRRPSFVSAKNGTDSDRRRANILGRACACSASVHVSAHSHHRPYGRPDRAVPSESAAHRAVTGRRPAGGPADRRPGGCDGTVRDPADRQALTAEFPGPWPVGPVRGSQRLCPGVRPVRPYGLGVNSSISSAPAPSADRPRAHLVARRCARPFLPASHARRVGGARLGTESVRRKRPPHGHCTV